MAMDHIRMFYLSVVLTLTVYCTSLGSTSFVHQFEISDNHISLSSLTKTETPQTRFRRDADSKCQQQEQTFLSDIFGSAKIRIEEKITFDNDSNMGMALAWAGDHGTMIVVTSEETFGVSTGASNIYRTEDYGKTFTNITNLLSEDNKPVYIRKHAGIFRHPNDGNKVYLVSVTATGSVLYTTEDAGKTFFKNKLNFQMDGNIQFHPTNNNYLLASSSILTVQTVYVSQDNGKTWNNIATSVQMYKWGTNSSSGDTEQTIYASVDPANTHPFFSSFFDIQYDLKKSTDLGKSWSTIMKNVISFGLQDKFLYVATPVSTDVNERNMFVSTNGGKTWDKTFLPTMSGERFFSVLDMNEGLVFMHVDNPGDTGHGTLYTSSGKGTLYSESLLKHLYPNYGDTTDFYRVQSMKGVYLASQMRDDNSIHTVITYNLGGTWHSVPAPAGVPCKDPKKECSLQIHGEYSRDRGIISELPLSVPSAEGVILAHGHVADALQTTQPDVFVTTDGGYTWRKALDGPHHYHIADSGSLLVAVPADTSTPNTIKFSTDEGNCWHTYSFIDPNSNDTIMFTGLLTEPGSKSLTVSIWGYKPDTRKWTSYIIDFQKVLKNQCDLSNDYEKWTPHENSNEKGNIEGCLLGQKETFQKVKKDSWCYNGMSFLSVTEGSVCTCVRDDYECDYGYYRPDKSDDCVKQPNFNLPEVDICHQGHEEQLVLEGYRKIPNDKCSGGFSPKANIIDLKKHCNQQAEDQINVAEVVSQPPQKTHNAGVLIAVFVVVAIIIAVVAGAFVYKFIILRRHNVTYRYSLLNQNDGVSYDDELENALTKAGLYHDSDDDDEELNSPAVRKNDSVSNGGTQSTSNGGSHIPKEQKPSRTQQVRKDVQSYHDDSDVDMLQ